MEEKIGDVSEMPQSEPCKKKKRAGELPLGSFPGGTDACEKSTVISFSNHLHWAKSKIKQRTVKKGKI